MNLDEQIKEDRYRNFMILLYLEDDNYNIDDVLFILKGFKYYAYITHKPEENEKKEHIHVFLHLDNATTKKRIAKKLGINERFVEDVKSVRASCRYLTHIDYDDKIQYKLEDVYISPLFERKFKKNFEDIKTEEEQIMEVYNFIDNLSIDTFHQSLKYLIIFINKNCYDTIFRRYRNEFITYLKYKF